MKEKIITAKGKKKSLSKFKQNMKRENEAVNNLEAAGYNCSRALVGTKPCGVFKMEKVTGADYSDPNVRAHLSHHVGSYESWQEAAEALGIDKTQKTATRRTAPKQKTPRPNPFAGADDIYVTKNKIVVTNKKNTRTKRGFKQITQTKYYEQNDSNTRLLKKAKRNTVRVGRTGNNYRTV